MSAHLPRFLNLPANSDPFALLGLAPQQCTPVTVEQALRLRIARTYSHPDGSSNDAEDVRRLLRDAAAKLKDPVQRQWLARRYRPPRLRPMLTPFDQEALAILVGSGGWNALSRARLVSLAQHHDVTPAGLMKVISGLSRYAREGRAHLGTADITAGRQRFAIHNGAKTVDRIGEVGDRIIERYAPALREESGWATVKLSIFFGLLAIVLAIAFVTMLMPHAQPPIPRTTVDTGLVPAEIRPGDRDRPRDDAEAGHDQSVRVATFERLPTFAIDLPEEVAGHAEACDAAVMDELRDINNRLAITDRPGDVVYRMWETAVKEVSIGWLLLDDEKLNQLNAAIADALFVAADNPAVSERLMRPLQPVGLRGGVTIAEEPLQLISGAWKVKQLARIIQRTDLPPILADQARTVFSASGGEMIAASIDRDPPARCAAAWLNLAVPQLLERLAYDDDALQHWELWIAAQRRVLRGEEFERSVTAAIRRLLASTVSLRRNEPGVLVLGRLVSELDLSRSAIVRRDILAMFDDSRLGVNRLAMFSAVLAANPDAPWMDESLLLPFDADDVMRRRVRQDLEKAWPEIERDSDRRRARFAAIDSTAAKRWHQIHDALMHEPISRLPVEQMRQLTAAVQLSQAAALLTAGDDELPRQGRRVLDHLEEQASQPDGFRSGLAGRMPTNLNPRGRGPAAGSTGVLGGTGQDGRWAIAYEDAGRNPAERLKQLQELRNTGGDLGPTDAALFVREVYRASPVDVREEAQMILTANFPRGITVAMFMLDLFHEAPRTELTGDLITRYTGSALPSIRNESWRHEARLALISRAIMLRGSGEPEIDQLASVLHDAVLSEGGAIDPARRHVQDAPTTTDAAYRRYLAWHSLARSQLPGSVPVPGDLTSLDRRHESRLHFAHSTIQAYVALTISTLELAAYVTSAEQPALGETLHEMLRHAAERRGEADELLVQAVLAERAITDVWMLRIGRDHDDERASRVSHRHDDRRLAARASRIALGITGMLRTEFAARNAARPSEHSGVDRWQEALESLDPRRPQQYFELAENIADEAATDSDRDLAQHLFLLAGVLAPERFGRSACLALAQMTDHRPTAERLRALANMLDPYSGLAMDRNPTEIGDETRDLHAALDLGEALSALRLGRGNRAQAILRRHDVEDLLNRLGHADAVDPRRLREDAASVRRLREIGSRRTDPELLVELALLAGAERPWTADLALYEQQPLIEVDEDMLRRMLGPNIDRPFYREGRWTSRP